MEVPPDIFTNDYTAPKRCKHGYFLFNRNDQFVGRALNLYGEWCEQEITTPAMGHAPEASAQVRQRGAQPLLSATLPLHRLDANAAPIPEP